MLTSNNLTIVNTPRKTQTRTIITNSNSHTMCAQLIKLMRWSPKYPSLVRARDCEQFEVSVWVNGPNYSYDLVVVTITHPRTLCVPCQGPQGFRDFVGQDALLVGGDQSFLCAALLVGDDSLSF